MEYSEQFDSPFWNKGTSGSATFVVTANQTTAPNGTNTADLISITRSATSELAATYTFVGQGVGTFKNTIWLKAKDSSNVGKTIDLWSWEGDTRGYTKVTLTADWVRYEQNTTVFTGTASELFDFGLLPISYSTSTTLAVEFYAWGAQSNIGSTAKPYFPTTDRLNVPRLTYQNGGGGCPSLLLEKQSTNIFAYSEQFDQSTWTKQNSSVTANATTSPDGTQNADKFIASNANVFHAMYGFGGTLTGSYTMSVYAKKSEYDFLVLHDQFSSTFNAVFNLNTGAVVSGSGASIENIGNGWYRCIVTFNGGGNSVITSLSPSPTSSAGTNYLGDGTSGIFIWGAQLEAGSYVTSYIPSTSASATRVADFATTNNISSLFGSTEGSFFIEMTADFTNTNGSIPLFLRSSINSTFNRATYLQFGSGTIALNVYLAGALEASIFSGTYTQGQKLKIAFAYKQNDFVLYINGSLIGTDTSGNISASLAFIDLGTYNLAASTFQYNGTISEAVLFPTRLTNAELAQLTA
jgi:hypothetical protein